MGWGGSTEGVREAPARKGIREEAPGGVAWAGLGTRWTDKPRALDSLDWSEEAERPCRQYFLKVLFN